MPTLFSPLPLGPFTLPTRCIMAPLTRCRAGPGFVPNALNALYYQQRAHPTRGASLIISEASQISQQGSGYPNTPGLYSAAQVEGWKLVTAAVHAAGGRIFAQLWHVGRISHPDYQPDGALPVAPSAINPGGECRVPSGERKPRVTPRALERHEIPAIIADYARAAQSALAAGFDGVEVHGANTYLPDQFLKSSSNQRTDHYGGSIPNRARFLLEAVDACIDICGHDRVGVRLSPSGESATMFDETPRETFAHVVRELDRRNIAYAHIMEAWPGSTVRDPIPVSFFRPLFRNVLIANSGFDLAKAQTTIQEGHADAVAFGRLFISNPDLTERFRRMSQGDAAVTLNTPDESTFYTPGERGYTDYPPLDDARA